MPLENTSFLDDHCALGFFGENNLLGKLISLYKYTFVRSTLPIFEELIKSFFEKNKKYFEMIDFIVPVPLHRRRLAQRGFNQSEELAQLLSQELKVPVQNILIRKKETKQQAKLEKIGRIKNVKNAFVLLKNFDVEKKNILLLDDVFTTGLTLDECARVFKEHGARTVKGFTLARG